ncbi:hypothetical protein H0H93_003683 [Arthromyces matolae]|nr:hypothetical protein H0H93_003683 [Arthromyces matolae]
MQDISNMEEYRGFELSKEVQKFHSKMQSFRVIDVQEPMLKEDLDIFLTKDIHEICFPPETFSYYFSLDQTEQLLIPELIKKNPELFPGGRVLSIGSELSETQIAEYFNHIIYAASVLPTTQNWSNITRYWLSRPDHVLSAGPWSVKPDLIMTNTAFDGRLIFEDDIQWPDTLVTAEATHSSYPVERLPKAVNARSFLTFYTQGDRYFATSFCLYAKSWFIHFIDRQGKVTLGPFTYKEHSEQLVIFILCLAFQDPVVFGCSKLNERILTRRRQAVETFKQKYRNRSFSKSQNSTPARSPQDEAPAPIQEYNFTVVTPENLSKAYSRTNSSSQAQAIAEDESNSLSQVEGGTGWQAPQSPIEVPDSIEITPNTNLMSISCGPRRNWFTVHHEIFRSQGICGRGTRVWAVKSSTETTGAHPDAVVKDSWPMSTRSFTEADFLDYLPLKECPCPFLPVLIDHDPDLHLDPRNKTSWLRPQEHFDIAIKNPRYQSRHDYKEESEKSRREERHYHRYIFSPLCSKLSHVHNLTELFAIMLDIVFAIRYLQDHGCVHRDVSPANILIQSEDISEEIRRQFYCTSDIAKDQRVAEVRAKHLCRAGLLNDFDHAAFFPIASQASGTDTEAKKIMRHIGIQTEHGGQPSRSSETPQPSLQHSCPASIKSPPSASHLQSNVRTGTPPFMSMTVLTSAPEHRPAFDLESLVYVLIFMLTHYASFNPPRLQGYGLFSKKQDDQVPIGIWFRRDMSFENLGNLKQALLNPETLERSVLRHIRPRFPSAISHIDKLWRALFPLPANPARPPLPAFSEFITILQDAILDPAVQAASNTYARDDEDPAPSFELPGGATSNLAQVPPPRFKGRSANLTRSEPPSEPFIASGLPHHTPSQDLPPTGALDSTHQSSSSSQTRFAHYSANSAPSESSSKSSSKRSVSHMQLKDWTRTSLDVLATRIVSCQVPQSLSLLIL